MASYIDLTEEEKSGMEWLVIVFIINYPEDSDGRIVARVMERTKGRADPTYLKYFVKAIKKRGVNKALLGEK